MYRMVKKYLSKCHDSRFNEAWARICKLVRSPRLDSKEAIPPACVASWGRYDNPIPTRFLASIDYLKIPALLVTCNDTVLVSYWSPTKPSWTVVGCRIPLCHAVGVSDWPFSSVFCFDPTNKEKNVLSLIIGCTVTNYTWCCDQKKMQGIIFLNFWTLYVNMDFFIKPIR
jgi:hypothetical protein